MTLKLVFTTSLLHAQQSALKEKCGDQAGKFTSCVIEKALGGILPSWSGRQITGNELVAVL